MNQGQGTSITTFVPSYGPASSCSICVV